MKATVKIVNKAINKKWPSLQLELLKGFGYFWVDSKDEEVSLKLSALYTTSIPISGISQASVERWVELVEMILQDGVHVNESLRKPLI